MLEIKKRPNFKITGVTLVELLIAVSLAAIVGLTVLSAFSAGMKAFERAQMLSGPQTDALLAFEKIERDLRNAFNWSGIDFTGNSTKIAFATLINRPEKDQSEGLVLGKVSYYIDVVGNILTREEQTYPESLSSSKGTQEKLTAVEYFTFDYYYQDPQTQKFGWKSYWEEKTLPLGIRIKLTFKGIDKNVEMVRTIFMSS